MKKNFQIQSDFWGFQTSDISIGWLQFTHNTEPSVPDKFYVTNLSLHGEEESL
jgi:hypothetical protein